MENKDYAFIIVESFKPNAYTRKFGVHIRPLEGQEPYLSTMFVECNKELSFSYDVGTRFRIKAKITAKEGGTPFIYSHYSWPYEVIK